jgi:4'-phosphopantetheinyl transferase
MWSPPPESLDLCENPDDGPTVHLWRLSLDQPPQVIERLAGLLTGEETKRAARFRFERDQNCYTLTRGCLRLLLGEYLHISPKDIVFVIGEHGKPALSASQQPLPPIEFNASHSGQASLFAFSLGRRVGVDVELMRPRLSRDLVAKHHFSPSEVDAVMDGDDDGQLQRFYRCWTRKEAYMKATGAGIALGLKSFAVSVDDDARLLWTDRGDADRWQLADVALEDDYMGAVCVEGEEAVEIRGFDVPLCEA